MIKFTPRSYPKQPVLSADCRGGCDLFFLVQSRLVNRFKCKKPMNNRPRSSSFLDLSLERSTRIKPNHEFSRDHGLKTKVFETPKTSGEKTKTSPDLGVNALHGFKLRTIAAVQVAFDAGAGLNSAMGRRASSAVPGDRRPNLYGPCVVRFQS